MTSTRVRRPRPLFLGPSPLHGVGVFTDRPIARGTVLHLVEPTDWRYIARPTRAELPLCRHFCVWDGEGYHCPKSWIRMSIGWYLNDSAEPNLAPEGMRFRTLRDVRSGEELLIDYDML